jgi:putative sugar O-methyltransferase
MKRKLKFIFLFLGILGVGTAIGIKKFRKAVDAPAYAAICISDNELYPAFCKEAAVNETAFQDFKRVPIFNLVHEHATYEEGHDYLVQVLSKSPFLLEKLESFRKNDSIGNPRVYNYPFVGTFSPTTLQYIKIAGDLAQHFGDLNGLKVLEIGGGDGGQCKILHDIYQFKKYTILDLPDCLELTQKALAAHNITGVDYCTPKTFSKNENYDLIISNYSFTEFNRKMQKVFIKTLFKKTPKGFLTCNFYPKHFGVKSLPKEELLREIKKAGLNAHEFPEEPLTGKDHFILVWKPQEKTHPSHF